jgi:hypothetical protein
MQSLFEKNKPFLLISHLPQVFVTVTQSWLAQLLSLWSFCGGGGRRSWFLVLTSSCSKLAKCFTLPISRSQGLNKEGRRTVNQVQAMLQLGFLIYILICEAYFSIDSKREFDNCLLPHFCKARKCRLFCVMFSAVYVPISDKAIVNT